MEKFAGGIIIAIIGGILFFLLGLFKKGLSDATNGKNNVFKETDISKLKRQFHYWMGQLDFKQGLLIAKRIWQLEKNDIDSKIYFIVSYCMLDNLTETQIPYMEEVYEEFKKENRSSENDFIFPAVYMYSYYLQSIGNNNRSVEILNELLRQQPKFEENWNFFTSKFELNS